MIPLDWVPPAAYIATRHAYVDQANLDVVFSEIGVKDALITADGSTSIGLSDE